MTDLYTHTAEENDKVISFPDQGIQERPLKKPEIPTPISDKMEKDGEKLNNLSAYKSEFNYDAFRKLERRYHDKPIRGGVVMKTAFRLVNSHSTCQQCLYAFEVDTYGRGCIHDCSYCYAKAELTVHGYWNNPIPVPVDINAIRKAFYTVFETDKRHKYRDLLERRIPLRIGSMSDSFMWTDRTYKITQELLKILKFYNYPYVVFTRSDLIAEDEYLKLLDPKLGAIQFSISSVDDKMSKLLEPGAPSPTRRLKALKKLADNGYWTTVRINPLFPIHPDGYFTDPGFQWDGEVPELGISTFDMVDTIADYKVPAILAGFGRFSRLSLNAVERTTGLNLRQYYRKDKVDKSWRDYHFSDEEIRHYYKILKKRADARGVQFTTCYIGNGEGHFWKDQDLWTNKKDCCNIKNRLSSFKSDSREVPFETRLKYTNHKNSKPTSGRLHEKLDNETSYSKPKTTPLKDSGPELFQ